MIKIVCVDCGHSGWCHGEQVDVPPPGVPCHAAVEPDLKEECPCKAFKYEQYLMEILMEIQAAEDSHG